MEIRKPIADLHCDLLCYLGKDRSRTAHDRAVRCSIPQLKAGYVKFQTMAVFTETAQDSSKMGWDQFEVFKQLPEHYPNTFVFLKQQDDIEEILAGEGIGIVAALENASAICDEKEDLDKALLALTKVQKKIGKLLYVSLTWNGENRFGGGAFTKVGLKDDGKRVVDYLNRMGIALDFSHTSDYLAFDLLDHIEKEKLSLPVLASHSNMRAVADFPRNMPDDLVREIVKRRGVIGLNFIRYLLGRESPSSLARHVEHLLSLSGEAKLCFGADFFFDGDVPVAYRKPVEELFFPDIEDAGSYPKVLDLLKKALGLSDDTIEGLCYKNFSNFFCQMRS